MRQAEPRDISPGTVLLPPVTCAEQVSFLEMVKASGRRRKQESWACPSNTAAEGNPWRGECLGSGGVQRGRPLPNLVSPGATQGKLPSLSSALMWHYYFLKTLKYYFYPEHIFFSKGTKGSQPTCSSKWQP